MVPGTAHSILDLIGHTPLLHLARFAPPPLASVFAKIEWLNPGGSVKDRAALGMILNAEETGRLKPGATIIEPTAGNTGIGLALVGIAKGYRVVLCVPRGFAVEKMKLRPRLMRKSRTMAGPQMSAPSQPKAFPHVCRVMILSQP